MNSNITHPTILRSPLTSISNTNFTTPASLWCVSLGTSFIALSWVVFAYEFFFNCFLVNSLASKIIQLFHVFKHFIRGKVIHQIAVSLVLTLPNTHFHHIEHPEKKFAWTCATIYLCIICLYSCALLKVPIEQEMLNMYVSPVIRTLHLCPFSITVAFFRQDD